MTQNFDADEAKRFAHNVYGDVPGWLALSWVGIYSRNKLHSEAFPNVEDAIAHAADLDPDASSIYLRTTTLRAEPETGRGTSDDSAYLPGLWADLDFGTVGHKHADAGLPLPPDADAALSVIAASALPPPTLLVNSGGGLYPWWLLDQPADLTASLAEWAALSAAWQRQLQAGAELLGFHYGSGVGDLARVLRLPGSVNRKTAEDRRCRVVSTDGPRYTHEALSGALEAAQMVVERRPGPRPKAALSDEERGQLDFRDATDPGPFVVLAEQVGIAGVLLAAGWTDCGCGRPDVVACFTRPGGGSTTPHSAHILAVEPHVLVVHSEDAGLPSGGGQRLTAGRVFAHLHHDGDESAAAHDLLAAMRGAGSAGARALGLTVEAVELFEATPTLRHIRQAAYSRLLGAWPLLDYVLARVLAELPPEHMLPPVVGGSAALNLGVAVVGNSGAGKSALLSVSREVLGDTGQAQKSVERNIGSGEGMAATFLFEETEEGPRGGRIRTGRMLLIPDPRRIMLSDEVDQLAAIATRNGATFGPTLRSAISGGALGQENASADRKRNVPEGTYRLVLLVGVQPTRSAALLKDSDAGTPQRLVWVQAADPNLPDDDVEWPGSLDWELPSDLPEFIDYPDRVKAEVKAARRAQVKDGADSLTGHKLLTRLKLGAALALLHGDAAIREQWWELAGLLVEESMRVQADCARVLAEEAARSNEARARFTGQARVIETETVDAETDKRRRVTENILSKVRAAGADGIVWSDVRNAIRAGSRRLADQMLLHLVDTGHVRSEVSVYKGQPGQRLYAVE